MSINPYSKLGYLALRKEATAGTPLKPNVFVELISEDIVANYNRQSVQPIAGKVDMNMRSVIDRVTFTGTIVVNVDPKNIGYFLTNFFGVPTTKTIQANKVFEHTFTMSSDPATYTMDIKPADDTFVKRYVGVRINNMEISQTDNKMRVTFTITARKGFTEARIQTATNAATQFTVDQTSGLTTNDVVEFRDRANPATVNATASVSSITSETVLVVGSAQTVSAKDFLVIRKDASPLYTLSTDMVWIGGCKYGDGDDIDNAETANDTEDATWTMARESEERHTANGFEMANRFPSNILLKGLNVEGSFQHFFSSPKFSERMRNGEKTALRASIKGKAIDTNSAQAASVLLGSAGGASAVRSTASVASETSNNLNVTVTTNNGDTLAVTKDGNNILVKKADTDTTKNTATLVAAAINALSGVTAAADGAGTGEVALSTKVNFGSDSNTIGRDANEKERLQVNLPDTRFQPFGSNIGEDNLVQEEINYTAFYDTISAFTTQVKLRNDISSY